MPLAYVPPEVAFEVRIQCTEKQIQRHCDAAPENDRRDFDDTCSVEHITIKGGE